MKTLGTVYRPFEETDQNAGDDPDQNDRTRAGYAGLFPH